jgi:hypothetical protein
MQPLSSSPDTVAFELDLDIGDERRDGYLVPA